MQTYTATDFKARALQIMKEVNETGKPVLVTKRGRPLVRIEMPAVKKPRLKLGALAGTIEIIGDIVAPVFDEWETLEPRRGPRRKRKSK
jgi:prevent-host-death family protein